MQHLALEMPRGQLSLGFVQTNTTRTAEISVTDLRRALGAMQEALWITAAFELGLESPGQLDVEQKRTYTLIVTDVHHSNLWIDLGLLIAITAAHHTGLLPDPLGTELEVAAILKVWDSVDKTVSNINTDYRRLAGDNVRLDLPLQLLRRLDYQVRKLARSSRSSRSRVAIRGTDPSGAEFEFQTNSRDNQRVLNAREEHIAIDTHGIPVLSLDRPAWPYEGAVIDDIQPEQRLIWVSIPDEYAKPIAVRYGGSLDRLVATLGKGDRMTVYGRPERAPGDRPDTPPQEIRAVDIGSIQRSTEPHL